MDITYLNEEQSEFRGERIGVVIGRLVKHTTTYLGKDFYALWKIKNVGQVCSFSHSIYKAAEANIKLDNTITVLQRT